MVGLNFYHISTSPFSLFLTLLFPLSANRNWGKGWGSPGASTNPCADDYRGPSAFSAPEALNIANYLKSLPNVALYSMYLIPCIDEKMDRSLPETH
jgi:hypothetical protein